MLQASRQTRFCNRPPQITSLVDLRAALGLSSNDNLVDEGYAFTAAASTALSAAPVSAINPRIIFVKPRTDKFELISIAFARGDQVSEIVARDRIGGEDNSLVDLHAGVQSRARRLFVRRPAD